jgi:predicted alpha-1,2-mannosidase
LLYKRLQNEASFFYICLTPVFQIQDGVNRFHHVYINQFCMSVMKKTFLAFGLLLAAYNLSLSAQNEINDHDYLKYVNPFIGTGSVDSLSLSGSNFPGAVYPFGLVQLSPDNRDNPDNPCSGYDYADTTITGFSHTHLSGTGVADMFDFLFMPYTGNTRWNPEDKLNGEPGYSSSFRHINESASPGYYSVILDDPDIRAEMTATEHCGLHRYTNIGQKPFNMMIDLNHSLDKERPYWSCKVIDAQVRIIDNHTVEGYRVITGWANLRKIYFRAEFSRPFDSCSIKAGKTIYQDVRVANATNLKLSLSFDGDTQIPLIIKVGLSTVSYDGARKNLEKEISGFDFDMVLAKTQKAWNRELSVIEAEGSARQKVIFYTSLYHTFIHPNNIADVDGAYINSVDELEYSHDSVHYSTFSLWDTYRAAHPLFTITQPKRTAGFINSMLRQYIYYGYLPVWQLWGKETYCMIGNHSIPVITDAFKKGIPGIDYNLAYEAIKASSVISHPNSPFYLLDKYKYIPENLHSQSVSIVLETAYNDWCVAMVARALGKSDDYNYFSKRSKYYNNLFDKSIGFFRAKNDKGEWIEPFSPLKYGGNGGYPFTEGNAWQYLWYVPQDIYGFMELLGGEKEFLDKLDTFFTLNAMPDDVNGNASGFIGQYAHGNEPSHHIIYLYDYTSEPWKAQFYSSEILKKQYTDEPSGYSGNEDCGQMSAWYVFSSMGFYPLNPASGVYCFGSPQFEKVVINTGNNKQFIILSHNWGAHNIYIQKIILNGKPYRKNFITHQDIMNGGTIEFFMGSSPQKAMKNYEKPAPDA